MKKYFFISLIILSGCSQNIANFTLVSTESTNLDKEYESIGQIEGVDIVYIIVVIPTGTPRIDEAVKNALLTNNADYITNTVIKLESFYFNFEFYFHCNFLDFRPIVIKILCHKRHQ